MNHLILLAICSVAFVVASSSATGQAPMSILLRSSAFDDGGTIPEQYTEDGDDRSPPLAWEQVPEGTKEFAVICDDPDAPSKEPWVHWVIYKIPADAGALPEDLPGRERLERPKGAVQGRNSWSSGNTIGYRGPAPPRGSGKHHYQFHIYALDAPLALEPGATKAQLQRAMRGHVLAEGQLTGLYDR
jgi:Raf kinase inhibitor-like YbhB/YbcL family protein